MYTQIDSLSNELEETELRIGKLRAYLESLKSEAKALKDKRDLLNAQHHKTCQDAKMLKEHRDKLNEAIKKLKEEKAGIYAQAAPKKEELVSLRKKLKPLLRRTTISERDAVRGIRELDWKIQTSALTLEEEKSLMYQLKALEEQALVHKELRNLRGRILELEAALSSLRLEAENIDKKIVTLIQESKEYHEKMLMKINEAEKIASQANEIHKGFIEIRRQNDEIYKKYLEETARLKYLKAEIRRLREEEEKMRNEALMAASVPEALRKLKEGRKITLDELKILKSKSLI
jgi:uncharacterized coiled-coil DUF342 family protein